VNRSFFLCLAACRILSRAIFLSLMVVSLVGLLLPPFPRDQRYHQLADQRILLGMPNFWNVVSNPPILPSSRWGSGLQLR
jgi:hypothetical protein